MCVAGKTVWSLTNACHTWAPLWWGWSIKMRHIKCHLPLPRTEWNSCLMVISLSSACYRAMEVHWPFLHSVSTAQSSQRMLSSASKQALSTSNHTRQGETACCDNFKTQTKLSITMTPKLEIYEKHISYSHHTMHTNQDYTVISGFTYTQEAQLWLTCHLNTSYSQHCDPLVTFIGHIFQLTVIHQRAALESILAVFCDIYLPLSHLTSSMRGMPSSYHIWYRKTRMAGLQSGENRMMIN